MRAYSRTPTQQYAQSMVLQPSLFGSPFESLKNKDFSANPARKFFFINTLLAMIGLVLLTYYIIETNGISADIYQLKLLNGRLATLNEVGSAISDQQSLPENAVLLADFVAQHTMVPARDVMYLFENGTVALRQNR